jgi:predicted TIM-barrel fold metal-dependent hydrolase
MAKHFDQYPNFNVDISARIGHLQFQSLADREKVRNFIIKYKDRIMYGTDITINEQDTNYVTVRDGLRRVWIDHWAYLATDSTITVKDLGGQNLKGLQLPREVIDLIYCKNAVNFFKLN